MHPAAQHLNANAPSAPAKPIPAWCNEPFRLFMPLGVLLCLTGVGHWFFHGTGLLTEYRPIFHTTAQIQGFLTAFASGFVLTMLPRRTQSPRPAIWHLWLGSIGTVGPVVAAWFHLWVIGQALWVAWALALVLFMVRRVLPLGVGKRSPPDSFIWLPLAMTLGIAGVTIQAICVMNGDESSWVYSMARGWLRQGMFVGLVIGIAGLAYPVMTRGSKSADGLANRTGKMTRALHLLAAAALAASFWVEQVHSLRGAMLIRAGLVAVALVTAGQGYLPPARPGLNRWLIWIAGWCVPIGYGVAALWPQQWRAGLHISLIAGFALLALSVGTQVILGHGGRDDLKNGRPWQLALMAALIAAAVVARALMEFLPEQFYLAMAWAAGLLVGAVVVWAAFVLPKLKSHGS